MKIFLMVLNTLADWEIAYLTAELHSKRMLADPGKDCDIVKVGLTAGPVVTMGGMPISPDIALDAVQMAADDLLLLPGAETWLRPESAPLLAFARARVEEGHRVAAICGGTYALAQSGALDRRAHTGNDKDDMKARCAGYTGEQHYQDAPVVRDGNLITASGVAPLEFTREVMTMLDIFRPATVEAWYQLYKTQKPEHFHALVASMA